MPFSPNPLADMTVATLQRPGEIHASSLEQGETPGPADLVPHLEEFPCPHRFKAEKPRGYGMGCFQILNKNDDKVQWAGICAALFYSSYLSFLGFLFHGP